MCLRRRTMKPCEGRRLATTARLATYFVMAIGLDQSFKANGAGTLTQMAPRRIVPLQADYDHEPGLTVQSTHWQARSFSPPLEHSQSANSGASAGFEAGWRQVGEALQSAFLRGGMFDATSLVPDRLCLCADQVFRSPRQRAAPVRQRIM